VCAAKDLGEPCAVARTVLHGKRAFGSLPSKIAPPVFVTVLPDYARTILIIIFFLNPGTASN